MRVRERVSEREREREREKERKREKERERECVCVCEKEREREQTNLITIHAKNDREKDSFGRHCIGPAAIEELRSELHVHITEKQQGITVVLGRHSQGPRLKPNAATEGLHKHLDAGESEVLIRFTRHLCFSHMKQDK